MSNRRTNPLEDLEARLSRPLKVALFGHRNVGKTTLLAMFYRQASSGQVPGLRLAAADARTAEYLAEKIAQIESGQPMAGSLAETELNLRLYHGPARFDLVVKDYQGEHVTLGSEEPIHEFFAGCDAVFLCLDPDGSTDPAERRRRQQEVENLLERYIERSDAARADRPVALLLTKFDRVLARAGDAGSSSTDPGEDDDTLPAIPSDVVERVVDAHYGMTRHALAAHAPEGAIFGVSSFGPGAQGNRPPAELQPMGLEGPLSWLAEQLEGRDRAAMSAAWDRSPRDLSRLGRAVAAYERRYPRSNRSYEFRERLVALGRRRRRAWALRLAGCLALAAGTAAGYDAIGFHRASAFEREPDRSAPSIARRWSDLLEWHPSLGVFWPGLERQARAKIAEWQVKAAGVQVANGTDTPELSTRLGGLKDQLPALAPAIREVEQARELVRHDRRWKEVEGEARSLAALDDPGPALAAIDAFLREFPDTSRRADALKLAESLRQVLSARRFAQDRQFVDDLARSESLPNVGLADLIDRARQFLAEHPDSPSHPEVQHRLDEYLRRLDEQDIARAREYSRQYPSHFAARIERYQDYLKAHQSGGRYVGEAIEAKERVHREWDVYAYRQAYDHLAAHPDDIAEVARRFREYLRDQPDGRYAADARGYLEWWEKISKTGEYRITLRRGEVEPTVGKYFSGAGPDLGVVLEVAGTTYGPSSIIRDSRKPVWDYTYPKPIAWKLGDPITIRLIDYDWSASEVYILTSRPGDPLAIRLLTGTIRPSKGGRTTLVFSSDFQMPRLTEPE